MIVDGGFGRRGRVGVVGGDVVTDSIRGAHVDVVGGSCGRG